MQNKELANIVNAKSRELFTHVQTRVFGQRESVRNAIISILCNGHVLLTGAPGLAKTTLVKNLAASFGEKYGRIQFTPDLTPFDILGGETIQFSSHNPGIKQLEFKPGPIFTPFLLADEINRASPRTQSALLEAMQERQVTLTGKTYPLPRPFLVFATQNPIENEGTFPLPEAQLDRFFMNIMIPYPDLETELKISTIPSEQEPLPPIPDLNYIITHSRSLLDSITLSRELQEAAIRIVRNTRPHQTQLPKIKEYILHGASPRASQALILSAKALALLEGKLQVEFSHIKEMAYPILRHRCILGFKAAKENLTSDNIITEILKDTIL